MLWCLKTVVKKLPTNLENIQLSFYLFIFKLYNQTAILP